MGYDAALQIFGGFIFVMGLGIIAIGVLSSRAREKSPTRRVADVLSGLVFCLLSLTVLIPSLGRNGRIAMVIAAVASGTLSWMLGRHAKRYDRTAKAMRR
jgi:hypothetical protein